MSKLRYNPKGIQMIPQLFHNKLYGHKQTNSSQPSKQTLKVQQPNNKKKFTVNVPWESVGKYLPNLKNNNVVDHLNHLGQKFSLPYLKCIDNLIRINQDVLASMPQEWSFQKGWTRYGLNGEMTRVDHPLEDSIVFDVEVSLEENNRNRPTLAVAVTPSAWYSWCSDTLLKESQASEDVCIDDLIPMGESTSNERLIVGHNVSFDRSYIRDQYFTKLDQTRFLDTMSLHICISGLNQEQKMFAIRNGNPWNEVSSLNNISDVYKLYCNNQTGVDKDPRDTFVKGTLQDVRDNFQGLMSYCANDVKVTLEILESIFPLFSQRFPNPLTLVGLLEMSVMYLPVNRRTWHRYLNESKSIYTEYKNEINQTLKGIATDSCSHLIDQDYRKDPWLWDLDWSTRPLTMKKSFEKQSTEKDDDNLIQNLLKTSVHLRKVQPVLPGYPKWFIDCCDHSKRFSKVDEMHFDEFIDSSNQLNISPKLRVMPKLLKLTWHGFPLHHDLTNGWGFIVPDPMQEDDTDLPLFYSHLKNLITESHLKKLNPDVKGLKDVVPGCLFYKLPHKDGPDKRVGNPLGKDFISKVNDGTLQSSNSAVNEVIAQQNKIAYWVNSSKRILSQMAIAYDSERGYGSILPRVVVAGTVTRRAVEPTWLTASNSYPNRLGSELKGIIQCPPDYCYVGADVDSQELWIASLLGDAHFSGVQGSTGLGWMTLQGDKSQGTDMHSVTAKSIKITRDEAKVLNYARIYGSGPDFAARFLRQSNPSLSEAEAKLKAKKIFIETKGFRKRVEKIVKDGEDGEKCAVIVRQWEKGSESHMFNKLEEIATSKEPETPILKCRISRALEPSAVGHDYITSRINWVVQSSAVDFLHILLVTMKWLMQDYQIEARFSISIHDEIRYIVCEQHRYRAALALQFANLMTRSFFTSILELNDLPASVAFFSSIEIDKCLRKDVRQDCRTPSNPLGLAKGYGVPPGESLNIQQLLEQIEQDTQFVTRFVKQDKHLES